MIYDEEGCELYAEWRGAVKAFDSENEPHVVVKTLSCGYAVK